MRINKILLTVLACLAFGSLAAEKAVPPASKISKLIEQLGDDNFATREQATVKLWERRCLAIRVQKMPCQRPGTAGSTSLILQKIALKIGPMGPQFDK